jgi:hypothetical protein
VLLVCWGYFIVETEATHSSESGGSSSSLSHRSSWVGVVDVWVWPPLTMNGALRGSDGEEAEAPSLLCTIPHVGFEWLLRFSSMV